MTNKIRVVAFYNIPSESLIPLPQGKTDSDISDIYIKWDTVTILFKDGSEYTTETDFSLDLFNVDTKRPSEIDFEGV